MFAALLRATQTRRDEAHTDKGAKKTAKGSVFKAAGSGERSQDEKALQKPVDDSKVENQLRDPRKTRSCEEVVATATGGSPP